MTNIYNTTYLNNNNNNNDDMNHPEGQQKRALTVFASERYSLV